MRTWPSKVTASTVRADEAVRDRVARRRDPDRGQLVDLAHLDAADPWPQHRQRAAATPAPSSSRSAGTAHVSVCTAALTSTHQRGRASFHTARSSTSSGSDEVASSRSRRGARRCPSTPDRPDDRSPGRTGSASRTGRSPASGSPRSATVAALQAAHPIGEHLAPAHRRASRSTRRASPSSSLRSRHGRTRTNRTRDHATTAQNTFNPPGSVPQSITSVSPGTHTAGRR